MKLLIVFLIVAELGAPAAATGTAAYVRMHSGGGVNVEVTYASPAYFLLVGDRGGAARLKAASRLVFLIKLDTHAGDLSRFDLMRNSRLRTGARVLAPQRWISTANSEHHRSGALLFPAAVDGRRVLGPAVRSMTLAISNLAGVPTRSFTWTIPIR